MKYFSASKRMRVVVLLSLLFLILLGMYLYVCRFFPAWPAYHALYYTPEKYEKDLKVVEKERRLLAKEALALSPAEAQRRTKYLFQKEMTERIFPYWMGTKYHFYGATTVPGKGKIACGYFVTTVLEDVGVDIQRVALAQMASEQMIRRLIQPKYIKRYAAKPLSAVVSDIEKAGREVYIIGLDTHTGFVVNDGRQIYFVHASGRWPWQVIKEKAATSPALAASKYRVTGCLTCDPDFMKKWLKK